MITFLAPAWRCLEAVAVSRKMPVDSTTTPTPSSFHGSAAGSFWAQTRTSRPLTKMASPLACTSAARAPWTESCLSRCASVLASTSRTWRPATAGAARNAPRTFAERSAAGEVALRPGRTPTREPTRPNGQGEPLRDALGEKGRLIEAALPFPIAGERHRDDRGDPVGERGTALLDSQVGERPGQRAPAAELEPMQRLPQDPAVHRRRARVIVRRPVGGV